MFVEIGKSREKVVEARSCEGFWNRARAYDLGECKWHKWENKHESSFLISELLN